MIITTMTTADSALYRLMTWLSPAFPVGGFSYSHGLEHAVEAALVVDAATAHAWIEGILVDGSGRTDATFFAAAWRAAKAGDVETLLDVAQLAEAMRATSEVALESHAQGRAFLDTVNKTRSDRRIAAFGRECSLRGLGPAYPVAVAAVAACSGIALRAALAAYLQGFGALLVSAAVRLVPLGQTDGQRVQAGLEPVVLAAARAAMRRPFDDVGGAAPMVDWTSMRHETQHTRLFRS
jgi:urease accessory protein